MEKCEHKNWVTAGYPENMYGKKYLRVQSIYHVYCTDCHHFINLLNDEILDDKGLMRWG